jgi:TPR repeat protein
MEALRAVDAEVSEELYRAAFRRFAELSGHGDPEAAHLLAQCHLYGWGTQPDTEQALGWFTRAFESGCPSAGNELFSIYAEPHSAHYDPEKARYYYTETRRMGRLVVRDPNYEK